MGCLLSYFSKKPNVKVKYCIPSVTKYLRPKGKIVVNVDRKYHVPAMDIFFEDFYEASVRLWSRNSAHENYQFLIKTPTLSSVDSSEEIGYNTVFS